MRREVVADLVAAHPGQGMLTSPMRMTRVRAASHGGRRASAPSGVGASTSHHSSWPPSEHVPTVWRWRSSLSNPRQAAGLPGAVIVAEGSDAPPKITLVGPHGERVTTPDGMQAVQRKPFLLVKNLPGKVTQIAIGQPAAGRWQVIVEDGSSAVVSLRSAEGLPEPEVHARVTGHGHKRAIAYRIEPRAGQRVSFVERGASAGRIIGEATGSEGRVRFSPADGEAERREIVAIVEQDGQVRDEIAVAHYAAPGPRRPARPRALRVTRRGAMLRLAWRPGRPARVHEVRVRVSDGRRLLFRTRRDTLTVRGVRRGLRATVSVRGILETGVAGRPAIARAGRRARG